MAELYLVSDLQQPSTGFGSTCSWYAIYTRHQREKTVARRLTRKEFETFLPLYTAVRRWKNGVTELSLPLFPCYVFLQRPIDGWLSVLTTAGIGGQPV